MLNDSWNTIVINKLMAHLSIEFLVGNPAATLQGKRFLKTSINRALDVRLSCTGNDNQRQKYELKRASGYHVYHGCLFMTVAS
jgi:succinylglutamate desuccinylase